MIGSSWLLNRWARLSVVTPLILSSSLFAAQIAAQIRDPIRDPVRDMPLKSVLPGPLHTPELDPPQECRVGSADRPPARCYCQSLGSYYSDVKTCPGPWKVSPAPARPK